MEYLVRHNNSIITRTSWSPMAQAAWHRATRDQKAGGVVELLKDGRLIARHVVVGGRGAAWPDGKVCDLQDLVKAIFQLLRDDEWDTKELAATMTDYGLPTSRSRLDALRGGSGRSAELSHAEIVTMIYAVLRVYKSRGGGDSPGQ